MRNNIIFPIPYDGYFASLVEQRREIELEIEKKITPLRIEISKLHKDLFNNEIQQYDHIKKELQPLVGRCFVDQDVEINDKKWDYVYYKIIGVPEYKIKYVSGYQSLTEIISKEIVGKEIEEEGIYELPVFYMCFTFKSDEGCAYCEVNSKEDLDSKMCFQCGKWDFEYGNSSLHIQRFLQRGIYEDINECISNNWGAEEIDNQRFYHVLLNCCDAIQTKHNTEFYEELNKIRDMSHYELSVKIDEFEFEDSNMFTDPNDITDPENQVEYDDEYHDMVADIYDDSNYSLNDAIRDGYIEEIDS